MSELENPIPQFRHYFVDEAGDPSLFKKHGKSIVGQDGCSKYFILGMADVEEPDIVATELESLRQRLLSDPYFKGIPSFDPAQRKTALMFRAKDDLPEVRREVFALLLKHKIRFYAVVRDKQVILDKVLDVVQKDIRNVHLSVHPPNGRVTVGGIEVILKAFRTSY